MSEVKSVFGFRVRLLNPKSYFNDEPIINWLNLLQKRVLWIKTLRSPRIAMPILCSIFPLDFLSTLFSPLSFFPNFFSRIFFPTFFSCFFSTCLGLFNSKLKRESLEIRQAEPGTLDLQSAPYPLDHGGIAARKNLI